MTNEEIHAALPVSAKHLAQLIGCSREAARRRVIALQLVPVQWVRTNGCYQPLYGVGPAAPRPPRMTCTERTRKSRTKRKKASIYPGWVVDGAKHMPWILQNYGETWRYSYGGVK